MPVWEQKYHLNRRFWPLSASKQCFRRLEVVLYESRTQNTTFGTKNKAQWPCVENSRLILDPNFPLKCQKVI